MLIGFKQILLVNSSTAEYLYFMSIRCIKCFRPLKSCYCSQITPVDTGIKFIFLMHPAEAYQQKTGTGRLASLSLLNSEIIVDKSFDNNQRAQELISDPSYYPVMLYPGKDAASAGSADFKSVLKNKKLLIFLLDATWRQARKMMYMSLSLQKLPRLSFTAAYRSAYKFKTQPAPYCLSTIESAYYLIRELQEAYICSPDINAQGLIDVFDSMVRFQIESKRNRLTGSAIKTC